MSNELIVKDDGVKTTDQSSSTSILNVKCLKLSERVILDIERIIYRRVRSENQIESNVNYDDLCGAWTYPENPVYSRYVKPLDPSLCVWKYFTEEDLAYLKQHQQNKDVICSFFETKLLNENVRDSKSILTKILWEFFHCARFYSFTEEGVSALLGIIYSTHLFFLSNPWQTAKHVYRFFYHTVLLHAVLGWQRGQRPLISSKSNFQDPPKSMEIFTVAECKLVFEAFHEMYMKNLVLIHILCHTPYCFSMNVNNLTSSVQDK